MPHKGIQGSNPCFSAIAKHEVRHWDVWPRSFLVHLLVHQIFGGYRTKSVSGPIIHRRYSTAAWSSPHTTPEPCSSGRSVVPPLRLRGHREEPLDILVDGHDAQDPCGRQGVFRMHAVSPEDAPTPHAQQPAAVPHHLPELRAHAALHHVGGGVSLAPRAAARRQPTERLAKTKRNDDLLARPFFLRRVHKGQRRQTATGEALRNARQHRAHNPRNGLSGRHKKERSRHAKLCQPIRRKR